MEESVKIYDTDNFNKLLQGIKIIQTSRIENIEVENVSPKPVSDIVEPGQTDILTCSFCKINFKNFVEQREHYKSDWHRYNLKQNLKSLQPISEENFEDLADDVSSISGSDTEKEDISDSADIEVNNYAVYQGKLFFQNSSGKVFSIYRCLLQDKKESLNDEQIQSVIKKCGTNLSWTILMLGGGHFAGAVFNGSDVVVHKTFHCYTVRAKQGGSQGSRDNKSGSNIKSAGASLRRYNEQQLIQHIGDILQAWESQIEKSHLIFYRAAGPYNRSVLFGGKNPILRKNDSRLRTIPFTTRRPTFTELKRVFDLLMNIKVYSSVESIKIQFDKQREEQLNNIHNSRRDSPKNKNINRAKSRESKERPLPAKKESSSESEDEAEYELSTQINEMSLNDSLKEYEDTVPESKKHKIPKKKRTKKKDKIKEVTENVKKQLHSACVKGELDSLLAVITSVKENKFNEEGEDIKTLNMAIDELGNTVLHIAALNGHENLIEWLLENESSPCNRNDKLQTPYTINSDKKIRGVFRNFATHNPDKYNYAKSQIPVIVSTMTQGEILEKKRAQRKAKREKEKEKKKEHEVKRKEQEDKERFVKLSDREKRALAAERRILSQNNKVVLARCFLCGEDITGKTPFEYSGNRFCTIECLKAHRMKNPIILS